MENWKVSNDRAIARLECVEVRTAKLTHIAEQMNETIKLLARNGVAIATAVNTNANTMEEMAELFSEQLDAHECRLDTLEEVGDADEEFMDWVGGRIDEMGQDLHNIAYAVNHNADASDENEARLERRISDTWYVMGIVVIAALAWWYFTL